MVEELILEGTSVCGGTVTGNVKVITNFSQLIKITNSDVLVIPDNNPMYAIGVLKAGGVICQEGGIISHICTVALEAGIPTITQVTDAIEVLKNINSIKLDADNGKVFVIR